MVNFDRFFTISDLTLPHIDAIIRMYLDKIYNKI